MAGKELDSRYYKEKKRRLRRALQRAATLSNKPLHLRPDPVSKETVAMFGSLPDTFFENLAAAIVYRAALDYEDYLVYLYFAQDDTEKNNWYRKFKDAESFFGSTWYYALVSLDHERIIKHLNYTAKTRIKNGEKTRTKGWSFASLD